MIFPLAGYFSFMITNTTVQKNQYFQKIIMLEGAVQQKSQWSGYRRSLSIPSSMIITFKNVTYLHGGSQGGRGFNPPPKKPTPNKQKQPLSENFFEDMYGKKDEKEA
jgi:hypothetical protein